jgi:DNA-binding winged helix-turn-helix (wHTH) protein/Flp pilus assembly protein TadD
MLQTLDIQDRIDLAREPAFRLGGLQVDPSRLTIASNQASFQVEPRVMAVLVALASAEGRVVSRDELVNRCWEGRIVADNAIQRVISRLRHLQAELGGFELQTVTKVGYLLRPLEQAPAQALQVQAPLPQGTQPPQKPLLDRRLLIGGLAAAAGGAGLLLWQRRTPNPNAEAVQQLIAKAQEAELSDSREANSQAIAFLKRATELDPNSAEAWGQLAMVYQQRLDQGEDGEAQAYADWTRSAASRALQIDPANSSARIALAMIPSNFRHWAANERSLRALRAGLQPDATLEGALGWLLCDVGRWQHAIAFFRSALALQPFHPGHQLILAWGLWGGGELQEAERLMQSAQELWPTNRSIWQTRFDFLALTGRPEAAIALVDMESTHPVVAPDAPPPPYPTLRRFAAAMQAPAAADIPRMAQELLDRRGEIGSHSVVSYLGALGRIDAAYAILEARFFGSATMPPPGPLSRRKTSILFSAKGAPLRSDPRYPALLQRLGITDYWRETGTRADPKLVTTTP